MLTYWRVIVIAIICCISNSVWRMTLAKLPLPWHVASVWKAAHLHLNVLEGSLSLFFYFCEYLMLQDQMVSIIGRRSDGHAIGSKKQVTDLQKRFLCQSSHICELISVESRFGVMARTSFLVLNHGFLIFWQLKPGQNNCKDSDSPCGESKPSIRSSSRDRLTDVSTVFSVL